MRLLDVEALRRRRPAPVAWLVEGLCARGALSVLDSFRSLWSGSERADAEVEALLRGLRELAERRRLGILLLHHSTKGGNAYRGTNAIAAGVDLAASLRADESDPDPARRLLEVFACRLGPPAAPLSLRLVSEHGRLRIEGAQAPPKAARARGGLKARIIAATTKAGGWLDPAELAHTLGHGPSEGSVRNT